MQMHRQWWKDVESIKGSGSGSCKCCNQYQNRHIKTTIIAVMSYDSINGIFFGKTESMTSPVTFA